MADTTSSPSPPTAHGSTVDYYDKLLSFYVTDWLVSGAGDHRTPSTEHPQEFWEARAANLISAGWLINSDVEHDLARVTNAWLKELCASYGLVKSGKKAQIIDRLVATTDSGDLRAACPGPYWVPSVAFQDILQTDASYVWYLHQNHPVGVDPVWFDIQATGLSEARWHDVLWGCLEASKLDAATRGARGELRNAMADQAHLLGVEGRASDQFQALVRVCAADLTDSDAPIAAEAIPMLIGDVPTQRLAPGLIDRMRRLIDDQEEFTQAVRVGIAQCDITRSPFTAEEMTTMMVEAAFREGFEETRAVFRQCGERHRHRLYALDEEEWELAVWLCEATIEMDSDVESTPRPAASLADPPHQRQAALRSLQAEVDQRRG